jgi:hypothetical protein
MKLHGLMLVKNEGDFLSRSLRHDLGQFDHIYVFDNGSTDDTWDQVKALGEEFPGRIVPWKSEDKPFRDELRGEIFNEFRDRAAEGDWWCRLDGDEIYADDPRTFLAGVPKSHHVVWSIHFQYYFSDRDVARWEADPEEAAKPLPDFADLPRSYQSNAGEARFFRHRDGLKWEGAWPRHMGLVHPRRIRLKHYQYRSPSQIQRRLTTRREAAERGYRTFGHSLEEDWREKVVDAAGFHQDDLSGRLVVDWDLLPRHLEKPHVRLVKRIMHGLGVWK